VAVYPIFISITENCLFFLFCAIVELRVPQGADWHSERVFLRDTNNLIL